MVDFDSRLIDVPEASGGLARETNWWGAFVIGLAGTVLIIGLIGYALFALGGFAIVLFAIITGIGVFLCFCLAEMAATWPERAGGLPSYAFETFKPVGNNFSRHVGGLSSWAYWLGWFTVAPINAFLAALYIVELFNIDFGGSFGPISSKFGAEVPVDVFVVGTILLLVMFIPCWLGIRLGATLRDRPRCPDDHSARAPLRAPALQARLARTVSTTSPCRSPPRRPGPREAGS